MEAYERVAAVVVTWNRLDLLRKALAAMEVQTRPVDLLIVVDNASTDGTGEYLAERDWTVPHLVVSMPTNTGGAGGFARGLDEAASQGYAAWLIDDDGVPAPDALSVLLEDAAAVTGTTGHTPAFMCSAIEWSDGSANTGNVPRPAGQWTRAALATNRPVIEVQTASFVSVLIPAEHARAVGLPYAEYHKWYDDSEYTFRLFRQFGTGVCSLASRVRHFTVSNDGVLPWNAPPAALEAHATGMRNRMSASLSTRDARGLMELARDCGTVLRTRDLPVRARGKLVGSALKGVAFRPPVRPVGQGGSTVEATEAQGDS